MQQITAINQFENLKAQKSSFVLYINNNLCNIGENVAPKLEKLMTVHFPKMKIYQVFNNELPELSAQLQIFIVPTILVYFGGKLYIQKSRSFSLLQLQYEIERYYKMEFSE